MSRVNDLFCILRAIKLISEESISLQQNQLKFIWKNSSLRPLSNELISQAQSKIKTIPKTNFSDVSSCISENTSRFSTVVRGLNEYASYAINQRESFQGNQTDDRASVSENEILTNIYQESNDDKVDSVIGIQLTASEKELLRKLDMEHREKINAQNKEKEDENKSSQSIKLEQSPITTIPNPKSKQTLSSDAKQRKVPSSRIGRMVSFGTLAAGLGIGTAAEYAKRTLGFAEPSDGSNLFMNQANLERIVDTLCKVRGAALKLGQILSIQDESIVNPELAKALERVRKSADFMPNWQVEKVMSLEFGPNWREKFASFEEKPFAAASIGQVHSGHLHNGQEVAIKIQYPGVAKGIESDLDNLAAILKLWDVFPKGMFLENLMAVAKRELAWEVDYIREAECTKKFKDILVNYKDYYVPSVIDDLSTKQVFTTEMLNGIPVDQCFDLDLEHREYIAKKILELCLLEILEFRYMQTDPNWANFLYDPLKKQLLLLDFGASREYSKEFIDKYVKILKGACDADRETVLRVSKELGFLTGYESKIMEDAHVDAVMILGEVFRAEDKYDFARQDMTLRIQNLAQTMISHRLCPPPEEIYSLHRKLSGVFLLCTKLRVAIGCKDLFLSLYNKYTNE